MKTIFSKVVAVVAIGIMPVAAVAATEVLPVTYSFSKATDCGTYCYHDAGGTQLTDGVYGVAGWAANLGSGNAYEWVGWVNDSPVNIDFNFGTTKSIDQIRIGTTQDHVNDVVLPSVNVYQMVGSSWSLAGSLSVPESSANDQYYLSTAPHTFLDLSGLSINSQYVRVSLYHSFNGPWTFTDEVDFYKATVAPVPEPETYAMMLAGLGLLGAMARRRKMGARQA